MSRYSFIDENINVSGKQCFCIDVNSSNSPFVNISQPNIHIGTTGAVSSIAPAPVTVPSEMSENVPKKTDTHQMINNEQNYLLTPQVIGLNKEKELNMINTINSLMTQTYSAIKSQPQTQSQIQASNATTIDAPKTSLTTDSKSDSNINLNTMANDNQIGKKTYRKSSSNLNLFEGFENASEGCNNVCKPSKTQSNKKRVRIHSRDSRSNYGSNDNLYLVIIILAFLLCSWFKK